MVYSSRYLLDCMLLSFFTGLTYGAIGMLVLWIKCDEKKKGAEGAVSKKEDKGLEGEG